MFVFATKRFYNKRGVKNRLQALNEISKASKRTDSFPSVTFPAPVA
ncbi:hypothetical protein PALB_19910 [Pseudoalteromonas luteoviolacea B = ATCC 29581]|nr:hypothetical protein PALB_19910 [Pseudoalteromonas luteoviolacea B = ATCC 29581]